MKLNKLLQAVGFVTLATFTGYVLAAEEVTPPDPTYKGTPTQGQILLTGELVNSACGLAPNSSPVQVEFGQITTASLKDNKRAGNVRKDIELQGCDTTVAKTATVTYTPNTVDPANAKLAAFTSGTASGAGVGLKDNGNKDVVWGTASAKVNLVNGVTKIPFVAFVQADSASASSVVVPGAFQSAINFQIDYQ